MGKIDDWLLKYAFKKVAKHLTIKYGEVTVSQQPSNDLENVKFQIRREIQFEQTAQLQRLFPNKRQGGNK